MAKQIRVIKPRNCKYLVQEKTWPFGWESIYIHGEYVGQEKPAYFEELDKAIEFAKMPKLEVVWSEVENIRIVKLRDWLGYRIQKKNWLLGWHYLEGTPTYFGTIEEAMKWGDSPDFIVVWP